MAHDVFICHSSKDKKIADAICAKLEQNRIRCWIAPRDVVPGSDFAESIVAAIHASKVTVFVFSANSNVSPHVSHELERSVSLGLPVLPFRVDDVVPSPALEYFISSAHWLDALTPPLEQHIDRLVSTVAVLLDRKVEPGVPAPTVAPRERLPRGRWVAAGLGALAVLAAVVAALVVTLGHASDSPEGTGTPGAGSSPTAGAPTSFADEFKGSVDPGWAWVDEDTGAWSVSPEGWLGIDAQESPPLRNVLLRDAPRGSYDVKVRLRFPRTPTGFAGLVLTGDDLDDRLQFGWTETGISAAEYADGNLTYAAEIATDQFAVAKDRDIQLILEIADGRYRTRFYNLDVGDYWDLGEPRDLDPAFTRIGLMAYRTAGPTESTAEFDRIALY